MYCFIERHKRRVEEIKRNGHKLFRTQDTGVNIDRIIFPINADCLETHRFHFRDGIDFAKCVWER